MSEPEEYAQAEREEPMRIWIEERIGELEMDFLNDKVSPEDQPLDDDIQEFLEDNVDDFDEYCREQYHEQRYD